MVCHEHQCQKCPLIAKPWTSHLLSLLGAGLGSTTVTHGCSRGCELEQSRWERMQNWEHSPALPLSIFWPWPSHPPLLSITPLRTGTPPCLVPADMKQDEAGLAGMVVRVMSRQSWGSRGRWGWGGVGSVTAPRTQGWKYLWVIQSSRSYFWPDTLGPDYPGSPEPKYLGRSPDI